MIRHIVMWRFRDGTEKEQEKFLSGLSGLYGVIPELRACTVARNCNPDDGYDAILVSDFDDLDSLNKYKVDPRHVAVSELCKEIRLDRVAVDYEF